MSEEEKEVNVDIEHAMLDIPAHAVEIEINAKVYLDGELKTVRTIYDFDSIRTAIKEAEDYIAPDDMFALTDEGMEYAKRMGWEHG